jgi:hypothetical protein
MYWIPLILIVLLAIVAVAWSPVFALVIAVPAFIVFLVVVGLRPRADEKRLPPTGSAEKYEDEGAHKGAWGEPRA